MAWSIDKNHKLSGEPDVNSDYKASFKISKKNGRVSMPDLDLSKLDSIIIHYTAGSSGKSSADWLSREEVPASAHLVIDRSGLVYQLLPFNKKAWHAGPSHHNGRDWMSNYSIGIELDNAGKMYQVSNGYKPVDFNKIYGSDAVLKAKHINESTSAFWHTYTAKQLSVCEEVCRLLVTKYRLKYILGHDEISPDRKTDPGPAFEMSQFRNSILKSDRSDESETDEPFEGEVTANLLNIRKGPNINESLMALPLPRGSKVQVLEKDGDWFRVKTQIEGWVSQSFVKEIGEGQNNE